MSAVRVLVGLIEKAAAASRPTVAVQLVVIVLDGELVVVGQFLTPVDLPQGKDDYVLSAIHIDDTRVAVWLAGMVDETCCIALHRGVHHVKVIDVEHVASDALVESDNTELVVSFTMTQHSSTVYSTVCMFS